MTSKWGNVDDEKVSKKEDLESYHNALILASDLTSLIIANKASPAVAATAVAILFGMAYDIACEHKVEGMSNFDVFNQMVKIAFATNEEFACQEEKVETKDDVAN